MIRFLLHLYPSAWRKEYGEEFADVLASSRLTLWITVNVLGSAAWQRLRYAPTWLPGAALFFLFCLAWTLGELPGNDLPDETIIQVLVSLSLLGWLGTGAWGAARKDGGIIRGVSATLKATLVGFLPQLLWGFLRPLKAFSITNWGAGTISGTLRLSDVPRVVFGIPWGLEVRTDYDWPFFPLLRLEFTAVQLLLFVKIAVVLGILGAVSATTVKKVRRRLA